MDPQPAEEPERQKMVPAKEMDQEGLGYTEEYPHVDLLMIFSPDAYLLCRAVMGERGIKKPELMEAMGLLVCGAIGRKFDELDFTTDPDYTVLGAHKLLKKWGLAVVACKPRTDIKHPFVPEETELIACLVTQPQLEVFSARKLDTGQLSIVPQIQVIPNFPWIPMPYRAFKDEKGWA